MACLPVDPGAFEHATLRPSQAATRPAQWAKGALVRPWIHDGNCSYATPPPVQQT